MSWHPEMTPKGPRDPNQLAKSIIDIATGRCKHEGKRANSQEEIPKLARSGPKVGHGGPQRTEADSDQPTDSVPTHRAALAAGESR
jgi:hypothetical protein